MPRSRNASSSRMPVARTLDELSVSPAKKTSAVFSSDAQPASPKQNPRSRRARGRREGTASAVPNSASKNGASAPEGHFLGDIAISPATARRYAKKHGRTLPNELQILILHGVLHLLGYDHETDNGQMTRVENRLRRKLGLQ